MRNVNALTLKQQNIIPIAAFTASGDIESLKAALNEGLDAGLTINEIKEVLIHIYAYSGFPRALNGIGTFMVVLEERKSKGINDEIGKEASPLPADKSSLESGEETQTSLVGRPVAGPLYEFAPAIDQFLKSHLFGDIFGRDILTHQEREVATIAALASMDGVEPQLKAHFGLAFNAGLTEEQLTEIVSVISDKVGKDKGLGAKETFQELLRMKNNKK